MEEEFDGRYRLLGLVGTGGMGSVYRAFDRKLNRVVGLKVLRTTARSSDAEARFRREARLLASLSHPGIVRLFDADVDGDKSHIAMELLEGSSLEELLTTGARSAAEVVGILRRILEALEYIHAHGILHRDIKPSNVFMRHGVEPVLIDFGLVRPDDTATLLTETGVSLGTPIYLPPEVARGQPYTALSDIHQVGLVGLTALVGHNVHVRPGERDVSLTHVLSSLLSGTYFDVAARLLKAHGALGAVLLCTLDAEPDRRPASARCLREMLPGAEPADPAAGTVTATIRPVPFRPPRVPPAVPKPAPAARPSRSGIAGLAAAGLLAIALFAAGPDPPRPHRPSPSPPRVDPIEERLRKLDEWRRRSRVDEMARVIARLRGARKVAEAASLARSLLQTSGIDLECTEPFDIGRNRLAATDVVAYETLILMLVIEQLGSGSSRTAGLFPDWLRPGEAAPATARVAAVSCQDLPGLVYHPLAAGAAIPAEFGLAHAFDVRLDLGDPAAARTAWLQMTARERIRATEVIRVTVNGTATLNLLPGSGPDRGRVASHALPCWMLRRGENTFRVTFLSFSTPGMTFSGFRSLSIHLLP